MEKKLNQEFTQNVREQGAVSDELLEGISGGDGSETIRICNNWICVICGQSGDVHSGTYWSNGARWHCPDGSGVGMDCLYCKYHQFSDEDNGTCNRNL